MEIYHGRRLGKELIKEGMLPDNVSNVELHIPVDGVVFLRYDVVVSKEDLPKLARALVAMGEAET